jgi:Protein of unknown function (DUF3037)
VPSAYEWSVLRAVPRVERCEFVNVGVVVYCQHLGYLAARVTTDVTRALALDAALDVAGVRSHLEGVRALCAGEASAGENARRPPGDRFRWLVAPRSTVVQPSPVHTGLTDDPAAELDALYQRMVEVP